MRRESIEKILERRPFQPVEIVLHGGQRFLLKTREGFTVEDDYLQVLTPERVRAYIPLVAIAMILGVGGGGEGEA